MKIQSTDRDAMIYLEVTQRSLKLLCGENACSERRLLETAVVTLRPGECDRETLERAFRRQYPNPEISAENYQAILCKLSDKSDTIRVYSTS
jgi:hypothetical protein